MICPKATEEEVMRVIGNESVGGSSRLEAQELLARAALRMEVTVQVSRRALTASGRDLK